MLRRAAVGAALTLGAGLLVAACVDPKSDYDEYLARTAAQRAAAGGSDDGGTIEAAPPDAGFSAQYVMASSDRGESWHAISQDLTGPEGAPPPNPEPPTGSGRAAQAPGGSIQALAPSPVAAGQIWIGTSTASSRLRARSSQKNRPRA